MEAAVFILIPIDKILAVDYQTIEKAAHLLT